MVTSTEIKRRVRDGVIERIREAYAAVVNLTHINSKLNSVLSMDPRNIIRDVVDGRHTAERMCSAIGLEHEAKTDVIPMAVPAIRECLSRIAIPQVVHPPVSDGPGVTD